VPLTAEVVGRVAVVLDGAGRDAEGSGRVLMDRSPEEAMPQVVALWPKHSVRGKQDNLKPRHQPSQLSSRLKDFRTRRSRPPKTASWPLRMRPTQPPTDFRI
jgi:hypothetical protein